MSNLTKTILVTGADGQLGMEFQKLAENTPGFAFVFANRQTLDITDATQAETFFKEHTFFACLNCAAYTAVDKAEDEREKALGINATATGILARLCKQFNARFIHFSTDYVFDGKGERPYTESDATNPVNFYGSTKLQGEQAAMEANEQAIVIRTSWVYSSFGKNFVKTMLRLMGERESIGVVSDQVGCPTYAADLAAATLQLLGSNNPRPGIYHYCNEGIISWWQFATAIRELAKLDCQVNPITTQDYPTPAARPAYSALETKKIQETFGLQIPGWEESLSKCLHLIKT